MAMSTSELREKQLANCKSQSKIALVITNFADDPATKATFYTTQCTRVDENGQEHIEENKYRYSQLLEFNEVLIQNYGAIRLLRVFPPKKWVGNREGNFVQQRMEKIQEWMTELVEDEEICDDQKLREFFFKSNE